VLRTISNVSWTSNLKTFSVFVKDETERLESETQFIAFDFVTD
jgi:hypothetical protein